LFRDAKWPQLLAKLKDVNSSLAEDARLSAVDVSILEQLVATLQLPPSHLSPDFRPVEISLVHNVLPAKFPTDSLFVVFDLWRLFVLHGSSAVMYKDSDSGSNYLHTATGALQSNLNNNTGLCAARYLANLFAASVSKWAAVDRQSIYLSVVATAIRETTVKGTQLACASVIANLASAVSEKKSAKMNELALSILDLSLTCLEAIGNSGDPDAIYRLLIAVGSSLANAAHLKARVKSVISPLGAARPEPVIKECCADILAAL
jgi:hypothetical protein